MLGGWGLRLQDLTNAIYDSSKQIAEENEKLIALLCFCKDMQVDLHFIKEKQREIIKERGITTCITHKDLDMRLVEKFAQKVNDLGLELNTLKETHQWSFNCMLHNYLRSHQSDVDHYTKKITHEIKSTPRNLSNYDDVVALKTAARNDLKIIKNGYTQIHQTYMDRNESVVENERFFREITENVEATLRHCNEFLDTIHGIVPKRERKKWVFLI